MHNVIKIIVDLFQRNLLVIVVFSFSWILVYFLLAALKFAFKNVLLRHWYYIDLQSWRLRTGVNNYIEAISSGKRINSDVADLMSGLVTKKIGGMDRKLSELLLHRNVFSILLGKPSIHEVVKRILSEDVNLLEKDAAFFAIFSENRKEKERGILNLINNPKTDPVKPRRFLLLLLDSDSSIARTQVLFHLKSQINSSEDFQKISEIIKKRRHELSPEEKKIIGSMRPKPFVSGA